MFDEPIFFTSPNGQYFECKQADILKINNIVSQNYCL